ncbi:MAG: PHP domain-containing protein [Clostridiales bacterium]|nr:PHP domain-containing protein [Clostridiales bacterium]
MKLSGDFHTHTTYTHGKSSIEENVKQAENLGLKAIAITEHCYNSMYAIKRGDLSKICDEIDDLKDKYSVKIYKGIEANLISRNGDIDIEDSELEKLDLVILGFHKMTRSTLAERLKFFLPNILFKKKSQKRIDINTNAYLKAMDKHRVSILAHLNYGGCKVDVERLAKSCIDKGIYIELNGKRINFSKSEIDTMVKLGVKFIINSDAHSKFAVGKNHRAFNLVEKYKIPLNQIANIDNKIPKFV